MNDINALALGGAVGLLLAVTYKIYTTVSTIITPITNVASYINKNLSISSDAK